MSYSQRQQSISTVSINFRSTPDPPLRCRFPMFGSQSLANQSAVFRLQGANMLMNQRKELSLDTVGTLIPTCQCHGRVFGTAHGKRSSAHPNFAIHCSPLYSVVALGARCQARSPISSDSFETTNFHWRKSCQPMGLELLRSTLDLVTTPYALNSHSA